MSFANLPSDWETQPLTDPTLAADVVDLFFDLRSREAGTLLVVFSGPAFRILTPVAVDDAPLTCETDERAQFLGQIATVGSDLGATGALLALSTHAMPIDQRDDLVTAWVTAWTDALTATNLTNLGAFIATLQRVQLATSPTGS